MIKKGGQFVNTPKVPPHSQGLQLGIFSRGWSYSFCLSYAGFMDNTTVMEWFRPEYRGKSSSGDKVIIFSSREILTHFHVGYIEFLYPSEILNFGGRFVGILGTTKGKVSFIGASLGFT